MLIIEGMRFPIVTYIFVGLFLVASILQLAFAFIENQKLRRKEKVLCMMMLGIAAIFAFPDQPLIYIGAFLGMIGDWCVLRKKTFNIGVVAFFLGHLAYIFECLFMIIGEQNIRWFHHIIYIMVYIVVALAMFAACKKTKNHTTLNKIAQSFYFAILAVYIPVFALAIKIVGSFMFLSLIGSIFFIISDSILVLTHFNFKFKRYDFYIMLTYLIAEFLIVAGFVLTLASR